MKIQFQAFRWGCSKNNCLSFKNYLAAREAENGIEANSQICFFIPNGNYYNGLVISIKNHKVFATVTNAGNEKILEIEALATNKDMATFNFFILDKTNGTGIYQYYYNSCTLNKFNNDAMNFYDNLRAQQELKEGRKLKGQLNTELIVSEESFNEKLDRLQSISNAEIELAIFDTNDDFAAIDDCLKRKRYDLFFNPKMPGEKYLDAFRAIIKKNTPKEAKIKGKRLDGATEIFKLNVKMTTFAEYDYDSMLADLRSINLSNVTDDDMNNNRIIKELQQKYEEIKYAFND